MLTLPVLPFAMPFSIPWAMEDTIGRETATVAPAERNVRRLFGAVACWITSVCMRAVSASFLKEGLKRYCNPPLAHEDTQLKQFTQREVSTVRFLLSIASALQVCSQLPQCVQASLSKEIRKTNTGRSGSTAFLPGKAYCRTTFPGIRP